jgi:hypothetical protein
MHRAETAARAEVRAPMGIRVEPAGQRLQAAMRDAQAGIRAARVELRTPVAVPARPDMREALNPG